MGRAVVFHGAGQPLELVRFAEREPLGGEILVRVIACTLCRSDLHTHSGRRVQPTPGILGHEILGRIESFGPEASRVDASGVPASVGDRVTWAIAVGCGNCFFCADGLPQKCDRPYKYGHEPTALDYPTGGGLADSILLVPRTAWFRVPDTIADRVTVPANCATATVAGLIRSAGTLRGRTVVILGAGVLGLTACAMACAAEATAVLAIDPQQTARERAVRFGATHSASPQTDDLPQVIATTTHGRGADIVLELAGTAASTESGLALVRTGGTLILAGTVSPVGKVAVDPEQVVRRMLTIRGVHNYHPNDLALALAFLAGPGRRFPFEELIAGEYGLQESEQAFAAAHLQPGVRVLVRAGSEKT